MGEPAVAPRRSIPQAVESADAQDIGSRAGTSQRGRRPFDVMDGAARISDHTSNAEPAGLAELRLLMPRPLFPHHSQAARILPAVRRHFAEAAGRCSLPLGFSLDMVPILEEELLGYELIPVGDAETCLTLGCKRDGEPVMVSLPKSD